MADTFSWAVQELEISINEGTKSNEKEKEIETENEMELTTSATEKIILVLSFDKKLQQIDLRFA